MKNNNQLKKDVIGDCSKAMFPTAVIYILGDLLGNILTIYTASVLGSFADAILKMDIKYGTQKFWLLLLCIVVNIAVVPLIGMIGEVIMFHNSLCHDRLCIGRFLDKTYEAASNIEPGEVQYRIEEDPVNLRCNWVDLVENMVILPLSLSYLLYCSLQISFMFTVIVIVIYSIKIIVPAITKKVLARIDLADREYATKMRACETEITEKPYVIKLYGIKKSIIALLDSLYLEHFHKVVKRSSKYHTVADSILSVLDSLCVLFILFVGALMVSRETITPGSVAAMVGYFSVYNSLISKIGGVIRTFSTFQNDIERMTDLYSHEEKQVGERICDVDFIEAHGLGFSYGEKLVFKNITFSIKQGDKLAVIGENGSGKSTLIMLLCGLIGNYEGSIKINGKELRDLNHQLLRENIAFVQQDPYLFEGSVIENIKIGNLSAEHEDIVAVMKQLDILYLSNRKIYYHDKNLSGGEKQRISIARAMLKGSNIFIFDEPSNFLDKEALKWITEFIQKCDKTVIFITHDEQLIQASNKLLRLE